VKELISEPLFSVYELRSRSITVWRGIATASAVQAIDRALDRSVKNTLGRTAAAIVVIEQGGFFGAAVRSILAGLQLLLRFPYPMSFVANAEDAATTAAQHLRSLEPTPLTPTELAHALASIPR